jgi:hypothetical protein
MKKEILILVMAIVFGLTVSATAVPLDLGTFTADDGATVSGNEVSFAESFEYASIFFYDGSFVVPLDATILSFNYDFALGEGDIGDYFSFEIDFVPEMIAFENATSASFSFDLTPYRGLTIDLAWGLVWGGIEGDLAGSTARLFNIDLARADTTAPVPEPTSIILFGTGIIGLAGYIRKKAQR